MGVKKGAKFIFTLFSMKTSLEQSGHLKRWQDFLFPVVPVLCLPGLKA